MKKIKISEQNYSNECGLCTVKSLIKLYYNQEVTITELSTRCQMNEDGISIYELENLMLKYGIGSDSYEMTIDEIKNSNIIDYFITIINNGEGLHYVIAKKQQKGLVIYDSSKGEYFLDWNQLKEIFCNIVIFCYKDNKKINLDFNLKKLIEIIDWKFVSIIFIFNLILIFIFVFNGMYMNNLINKVINNNSVSNLITLNVIYVLMFICQNFINYFISKFSFKNKLQYFNLIYLKTINNIINLNEYKIKKYKVDDLININTHVFSIADFYAYQINQILSYLIHFAISLIFLSILNPWNLLVVVTISSFISIFNYINHCASKKYVKKSYLLNNNYTNSKIELINNIKNSYHTAKKEQIKKELLLTNISINTNNHKFDDFNNLISLFFNSIQSVFFILLISVNVLSIINGKFTLGKMLFSINLLQTNINNMNDIFSFYVNYPNLKYSQELLMKIINENNKNQIGVCIDYIDSIAIDQYTLINDTLIIGKNGCGKTTLLKNLCKIRNDFKEIRINNININNISSDWIKNNIIYISNNYQISSNEIISLLNSSYQNEIIAIINEANIADLNDFNKLSSGQKQVLMFLSLINLQNKIILTDEIMSNLSFKMKKILNKKIKPIILQKNFLISVEHDQLINKYYKNIIEVKNE